MDDGKHDEQENEDDEDNEDEDDDEDDEVEDEDDKEPSSLSSHRVRRAIVASSHRDIEVKSSSHQDP
jgi:hypothetical protein